MQYRHITLSDRKVIQKRLDQGKNQKDNKKLFWHVLLKLKLRWSPEQIAGRLKSFADRSFHVSTETIYMRLFTSGCMS